MKIRAKVRNIIHIKVTDRIHNGLNAATAFGLTELTTRIELFCIKSVTEYGNCIRLKCRFTGFGDRIRVAYFNKSAVFSRRKRFAVGNRFTLVGDRIRGATECVGSKVTPRTQDPTT